MKKEEQEKKDVENLENEKVSEGSTYRKVENTKHKTGITLKKFIILVFVFVLVIALIIGIRWRILCNIRESYENISLKNNWYYYSESEDTIMEVWRKGTTWKMNTRQKKGNGNLTFWKDARTDEAYVFYEGDIKKYSVDKGGMISSLPTVSFDAEDEKTRLLIASMPMLWIGTGKYDNIDCYIVEIEGQKEYINKETGLVLGIFQNNKQIRSVEYKFGEVTDEDVAKPDLSKYEYIE